MPNNKDRILIEIKRIKETFDSNKEIDSRSVPFNKLARLFNIIEEALRAAGELNATIRLVIVAERIKKIAEKLLI